MDGKIKFISQAGYCFIIGSDDKDYFAYCKSFQKPEEFSMLIVGDKVRFEVRHVPDKKCDAAFDIIKI